MTGLLAMAAGAGMADWSRQVKSESFLLVDRFGQPRVSLGLEGDGTAALQFLDKNAKPRMSLSLNHSRR